jgi:hypothetical protein
MTGSNLSTQMAETQTQTQVMNGDGLLSPFGSEACDDWTFSLAPSPVDAVTVEEDRVVVYATPTKPQLPVFTKQPLTLPTLPAPSPKGARAFSVSPAPSVASSKEEEEERAFSVSPPPKHRAPSDKEERAPSDKEEEERSPTPSTPRTPTGLSPNKRRYSSDASDDEEEEEPRKKQAREASPPKPRAASPPPKKQVRAASPPKRLAEVLDDLSSSSSSDESSDEEEAPKRWTQPEPKPKKAGGRAVAQSTKPQVRKDHVEKWIATSDHRAIRANARNSRGEPRSLFVTSKFKLGGLKGLSPLRFAILHVFRARDADAVDAALETVRVLLVECGVSAEYTETREELLTLLAAKAPKAFPQAQQCDARVLEALLTTERSFLAGSTSIGEAVACFAANGRQALLSALLRARGEALAQSDLFEALTQTLVSGHRALAVSALRLVGRRLRHTTVHPKTGSTLLHFVAKRDDGAFVADVLPYCDAAAVDKKERTALYYLERTDAPAELIERLRAAQEDAARA